MPAIMYVSFAPYYADKVLSKNKEKRNKKKCVIKCVFYNLYSFSLLPNSAKKELTNTWRETRIHHRWQVSASFSASTVFSPKIDYEL